MKRREFAVKSILATAAIGVPTLAMANLVGKEKVSEAVNIGIIGTGVRGCELIRFINQIENLKVVACCDIIPFRLEEGLRMAEGNAMGYKDYRRLLENSEVDAVLVATPFNSHSKIAIDALDAEKHVYCETTMAKGFYGIRNLVNKVKSSNQIFQVGHQYHSSVFYTHVIDLIKKGTIGKITSFECYWTIKTALKLPVPNPELKRLINWRMYREFSGGLLAEGCSHQLYFVNWVLNTVPDKVVGTGSKDHAKDNGEIYDNIHLQYSYPDGVQAKFIAIIGHGKNNNKIVVKGEKGSLVLEKENGRFYPKGEYEAGAIATNEKENIISTDIDRIDSSKQAIIDFKDNITNNQEPVSNVIAGAKTAICVQMGFDAMQEGEEAYFNTTIDLGG